MHNSRPSSVVERVAFNHVAVGSIPTVGVSSFLFHFLLSTHYYFKIENKGDGMQLISPLPQNYLLFWKTIVFIPVFVVIGLTVIVKLAL